MLKKSNLKATETVVTHLDGKVLKETKNQGIEHLGHKIGYVVDSKPDSIPAKIIEYVYLGSQDCCEYNVLEKYNIQYVLSIGIEAPVKYSNVTYKFVECLDLPEYDLQCCLRECIPFIEYAVNQSCNILIHCNAGVSRSSSVVIAYLMLLKNYDYIESYNIVKSKRSCIKPNSGFEKQLRSLGNNV